MTSRTKYRDNSLSTCSANAREYKVAMSDADIVEALENSGGIYKSAAAWLGENKGIRVTGEAIRLRVIDNEDLLKIKNTARREITDIAQTNIVKAIKNGETRESEWWLTNSPEGKAAGFGSKSETVIANANGEVFKVEEEVKLSVEQWNNLAEQVLGDGPVNPESPTA